MGRPPQAAAIRNNQAEKSSRNREQPLEMRIAGENNSQEVMEALEDPS